MDNMISNALVKFRDLVDLEKKVQVGDKEFMKQGFNPVLSSTVDRLNVSTLTGISDFIEHSIESECAEHAHIHVKSPTEVLLQTESFGPWLQRHVLVASTALVTDFGFGLRYNPEEFIIALLSQFQDTEHRASLLYACSKITKESADTLSDTGTSQKMEVRQGVSMRREVEFKNPVILRPFRTFPEIEQPESEFVFRIHGDKEISLSLHEADGSAWKLKAITGIRDYFNARLPGVPVIA